MTISFCIPTYNRCKELLETTSNIIKQAIEIDKEADIEICISDNASSDNTNESLLYLKNKYPLVRFNINYNITNVGYDKNVINVLNLATGDYIVLKGDDDYIREGGVKRIFELIDIYKDIDIFITDLSIIDNSNNKRYYLSYLSGNTHQIVVDFTDEIQARNYFALCNDILPLGSFISTILIKAEAMKANVNKNFIGTNYVHLFYIWNYLFKGHKLLYLRESYIESVLGAKSSFGKGFSRIALDFNAICLVADTFIKDPTLNQDFKNVINRKYKFYSYIPSNKKKEFREVLYPLLKKSGHPYAEIINKHSYTLNLFIYFILSFLPSNIVNLIKKWRKF